MALDLGAECDRFAERGETPPKCAEELVRIDLRCSKHLGQLAVADVAEKVHLPVAVLGLDEALSKQQILSRIGVNMGHAVDVADDLDFTADAPHTDLAVDLGE